LWERIIEDEPRRAFNDSSEPIVTCKQ
jgi:hypothetical protein